MYLLLYHTAEILPRVLIINILLTLGMRFMGRRSRQVVCGEQNGRTLFALPIFLRITKKFVKKIENVEVQKKRGVRFLQNKKRPHLGDVLVLFFCSEWCEWYACFIEDSYLAIVEPVISCIERFFNGV